MFFSEGFDFRKGILMNVPRSPTASAHGLSTDCSHQHIFADLSMVVQDAEAHAYAFDWMGSGCKKCCPCCWNLVSKHCNLVKNPTGSTIPIYTLDTRRFHRISNTLFRDMQDRLKHVALHGTAAQSFPPASRDNDDMPGTQHRPDYSTSTMNDD